MSEGFIEVFCGLPTETLVEVRHVRARRSGHRAVRYKLPRLGNRAEFIPSAAEGGFSLPSLAERQFVVHTLIHAVINSIRCAQFCINSPFYFSMIFE
jgi:hypothetical protein